MGENSNLSFAILFNDLLKFMYLICKFEYLLCSGTCAKCLDIPYGSKY